MADNAFVKIGTALLKHQVKKLVGEEALGAISEELAEIGGDKLDAWLGDKSAIEEIEKAAATARNMFRGKLNDDEVEQWMVMLPIHDLPAVLSAIEELPTSPDETKLEGALRETIAQNWKKLSPEQVNNAVNSFLACLRSALLPIEKQTLMVIGRAVLRTEDKVNLLVRWFEQYIITGKPVEVKQPNPEPDDSWYLAHPYPMPPNFTGRVEERKMLVDWLNSDSENRLLILRALGGFGKSALSWHWLTHDVDSKEWKKVLFWSFYEGDASFEHFIEETLKYLKLEVPQGQRPQVDKLLDAMKSQKILLIMDGFERALRLYADMNAAYQSDYEQKIEDTQLDCVNINAEWFLRGICSLPNVKSKILMTTRLTPRVVKPRGESLQGCLETELKEMDKADAVTFFHAQKVKGTYTEIEAACAAYGYHPLSLRILAGVIINNRENPGGIKVTESLDITDNIVQNKNHVLEVAYNSLSMEEQKLLSNISCLRSPTNYQTVKAIYGIPSRKRKSTKSNPNLNELLHMLEGYGLLQWDRKANKYDLHPIVRRYVYRHMKASDRTDTHLRLRNYFTTIKTPDEPKKFEDLLPLIELYHHTIQTAELYEAAKLFRDRLHMPLYYQQGKYGICIQLLQALFVEGEDKPPQLGNESAAAWIMNELATSYSMTGQPKRAIPLYEATIQIDETHDQKLNLSVSLGAIASVAYLHIGAIQRAESNHRREIELCKQIEDEFQEAAGHVDLGLLLAYRGIWHISANELESARKVFDSRGVQRSNSVSFVRSSLAHLHLLQNNVAIAIEFANEALSLAEHSERSPFSGERDIVRAHWLLGAAYRLNVQLAQSDHHLNEALIRDRAINLVQYEANILLDLARLRYDQTNYEEAKSLAEEALLITERCGYVLQGADVNLFLAQYALEQEQDKTKAKQYAEAARKLATCDGPPYYYKVAYEEAERMLAGL